MLEQASLRFRRITYGKVQKEISQEVSFVGRIEWLTPDPGDKIFQKKR